VSIRSPLLLEYGVKYYDRLMPRHEPVISEPPIDNCIPRLLVADCVTPLDTAETTDDPSAPGQ
jgi:hypothetical protein